MGASDRQTRLRLARRRPQPDRMRARERHADPEEPTASSDDGVVDPPEEPEEVQRWWQRWWRRLDGAHLVNVIGVIAAIGTLAATAYATYYGAEVAKEQLQQSQEEAEQTSREQAARVSFWVASGDGGDGSVHLLNRSPDPVQDVLIGYADVEMPSSENFFTRVGHLAPCTELVYEHGLEYLPDTSNVGTGSEFDVTLEIRGVSFFDRDGIGWTRRERDLKKGATEFGSQSKSLRVVNDAPTAKSVASCGSQD
ncbi:hypothetical protein ACIRL0_36005 [Streptomyces sp. NPDC102365]|uniref:hypothetical protein n=1 Tax=Streptomyces sp. NPDC102365 TaxID=3366162 RepID=UPI003823E549